MKHLLNLLAAIALLVWGTHMARTGILRVFGASLCQVLSHSLCNRFRALVSGLSVTAMVQSSTAAFCCQARHRCRPLRANSDRPRFDAAGARDPLHNSGGTVVRGSGWAARRLFAVNSPAIGKKSNAADRPSPGTTDRRELCRGSLGLVTDSATVLTQSAALNFSVCELAAHGCRMAWQLQ